MLRLHLSLLFDRASGCLSKSSRGPLPCCPYRICWSMYPMNANWNQSRSAQLALRIAWRTERRYPTVLQEEHEAEIVSCCPGCEAGVVLFFQTRTHQNCIIDSHISSQVWTEKKLTWQTVVFCCDWEMIFNFIHDHLCPCRKCSAPWMWTVSFNSKLIEQGPNSHTHSLTQQTKVSLVCLQRPMLIYNKIASLPLSRNVFFTSQEQLVRGKETPKRSLTWKTCT